jgi:phosphoglycerate dehydrogenase-like enzyme
VDEVLTSPEGLLQLLSQSHYVVLAAALTQESRALIGAEQIAAMKPSAWIVNIARGALIDETALLEALQGGRIGGACLDVFAQEPLPADHPFWDLPNVYISPHDSPDTDGLRPRQFGIFASNLAKFIRNEPLDNVVDVTRGY